VSGSVFFLRLRALPNAADRAPRPARSPASNCRRSSRPTATLGSRVVGVALGSLFGAWRGRVDDLASWVDCLGEVRMRIRRRNKSAISAHWLSDKSRGQGISPVVWEAAFMPDGCGPREVRARFWAKQPLRFRGTRWLCYSPPQPELGSGGAGWCLGAFYGLGTASSAGLAFRAGPAVGGGAGGCGSRKPETTADAVSACRALAPSARSCRSAATAPTTSWTAGFAPPNSSPMM